MWDSNPRTRRRAYGVQDRCIRRSANPPRRREEDSNLWTLKRASRFRGGRNRRSATPPDVPAAAGGGESRTRTYGGTQPLRASNATQSPLCHLTVVELRGLEPRSPACDTGALPLSDSPMEVTGGLEPPIYCFAGSRLTQLGYVTVEYSGRDSNPWSAP